MTTTTLSNDTDPMPPGLPGDEFFVPGFNDGVFWRYEMTQDGIWEHDGRGEYRKDAKTGQYRQVLTLVRMNGYTSHEYRQWLMSQGFAAQ